ncbi:MAG: tyrosine-type recombinase/integrase [Candidatus Dormibacteria bacterium]
MLWEQGVASSILAAPTFSPCTDDPPARRVAGDTKRVYPHLLRHSHATHAIQKGMNPLMLQQIVGHSTLDMITRVYTHLSTTDRMRPRPRCCSRIASARRGRRSTYLGRTGDLVVS